MIYTFFKIVLYKFFYRYQIWFFKFALAHSRLVIESKNFLSRKNIDMYFKVLEFNPCNFSFVVEEEYYNISSLNQRSLQNRKMVLVVLDWAIENKTC